VPGFFISLHVADKTAYRAMTIKPIGDQALTMELGSDVDDATLQRVRRLLRVIEEKKSPLIVDVIAAYTTVTVVYDATPLGGVDSSMETVQQFLAASAEEAEASTTAKSAGASDVTSMRVIKIPVCYGGRFGPDLEIVATQAELSVDEVIALHAGADYDVCAIGFSPGFPYLRGLPERLRTPRKATPRTKVPAGSVGIGGSQTGIYPSSTPGGWQLIGRTPLSLFDVNRPHPSLLRVGDRVHFVPMTEAEFTTWRLL
jgi:inhibitor of KinA